MKAVRVQAMVTAIAAVVLLAISPHAAAQGVAMVSDVWGRVAGTVSIGITSELPAGARVRLEDGATLVAIYLNPGDEYTFTGPAEIEFGAGGPQVIVGAPPRRRVRALASGSNIKFRQEITPAGLQLRNIPRAGTRIRLTTLSGTTTLETNPEFRWEVDAKATYRFELVDDTGKPLHETEVAGGSYTLPAAMALREGARYTWELSARLADGRRQLMSGDFTIATAELRRQAQNLRPADGAAVSDRVVYAVWLEQGNLRDEARKYWKALAAERPEDAKLKDLARE